MTFFFLLLALSVSGPSSAQEIYKWTDENGVVHFSDSASPDNIENVELIRETPPLQPLMKTTAAVDVFETSGIVKYALYAGQERNDALRQYVQRLTATGDKLWITYTGRFVSFDPQTNESSSYAFDHLSKRLNGNDSHISDHHLILLESEKYGRSTEFHIFDLTSNTYYTAPLDGEYLQIVPYVDKYDDGLLMFNYIDNILYKYNDIPTSENGIERLEFQVNSSLYLPATAMTKNALWFLGSPKKPCSPSYIDKKSGKIVNFNYREIGIVRQDDRCLGIVADDDEVWISISKNPGAPGDKFAIFDIESQSWYVFANDNDGYRFTVSKLMMDADRVYFGLRSCSELVAMDRKQRVITTVDLDKYESEQKDRGCIDSYTLRNGDMWALRFENRARQRYPVLYQIPSHNFDPRTPSNVNPIQP